MLNTINSYSKANVVRNLAVKNPIENKKADTPVANEQARESQFEAAQRQQGITGRVFCNISSNNKSSVNSLKTLNFCGSAKAALNSNDNTSISRNLLLTEKLYEKKGFELYNLSDKEYAEFMENPQNYGISPIELQKMINTSFVEAIGDEFSISIDNRKILLPPSQKAIYDEKIKNYTYDEKKDNSAKTIKDSHYGQVIMSDAMLIEALAVKNGLDIKGIKTEEIFDDLSTMVYDDIDLLPDVTFEGKRDVINAFFAGSFAERMGSVAGMSGDKAVHELCKALCNNLENDKNFQNNWIEYCNSSDKFKQYSALADTYKDVINNQLKTTHNIPVPDKETDKKIENLNHVIFRAIQRDCLFDFDSMNWEDWENDLDIDELSFPYRLAEKIASNDNTEDFMGKILTREGQDKFQTIMYKLPKDYWAKEAEYFPNAV